MVHCQQSLTFKLQVKLLLTFLLFVNYGSLCTKAQQYDYEVVTDSPVEYVDSNGDQAITDDGPIYVTDDLNVDEPIIGDLVYDTDNDIITSIPGNGESITEEILIVDGDQLLDEDQEVIVVDGTEIPLDDDGSLNEVINDFNYDYGDQVIIVDDPITWPPYVPPTTTWPPYVPPTTWPPYVPPTTWPPYVPPTTWPPYVPPTTWPPYTPPPTAPPPRVIIINNGTMINDTTGGAAPVIINNYNNYNYYNNTTYIQKPGTRRPVKVIRRGRQGRNLVGGQKNGNKQRMAVNGNGNRRRLYTRKLVTRNIGVAGGAGNVQVYRVIRAKNTNKPVRVVKLRKQGKKVYRTLNRRQALNQANTTHWRVVPSWKAQKMQRLGMNVKVGQIEHRLQRKRKGVKIIPVNNSGNMVINGGTGNNGNNPAKKMRMNNNAPRLKKRRSRQFALKELHLGLDNRLQKKRQNQAVRRTVRRKANAIQQ